MFWCEMDTDESPSIQEPDKASDIGWFSYEYITSMFDELFLPLQNYVNRGDLLTLFDTEKN